MTALTVGITTARNPACKRGLAVNLAASLARDTTRSLRVCVVDADPLTLDVTTRLAVRGPRLEDFADHAMPRVSALGSVHEPPLWVLPSAGAGVGLTHRATERALRELRGEFDVVICDLPVGCRGRHHRRRGLDRSLARPRRRGARGADRRLGSAALGPGYAQFRVRRRPRDRRARRRGRRALLPSGPGIGTPRSGLARFVVEQARFVAKPPSEHSMRP